ncbi:PREDICTED: translation initiation factor IF-2-like [Chinchilla lanigera]|uniref:translation initiation factor IF-2-like n=1 Tax=Chinchilla lanigera TaxID=34839 RepID=UPI000697016C|nr:PREDICTED: translation initiation factor IF-2-like [Chinchilla lanigera]
MAAAAAGGNGFLAVVRGGSSRPLRPAPRSVCGRRPGPGSPAPRAGPAPAQAPPLGESPSASHASSAAPREKVQPGRRKWAAWADRW